MESLPETTLRLILQEYIPRITNPAYGFEINEDYGQRLYSIIEGRKDFLANIVLGVLEENYPVETYFWALQQLNNLKGISLFEIPKQAFLAMMNIFDRTISRSLQFSIMGVVINYSDKQEFEPLFEAWHFRGKPEKTRESAYRAILDHKTPNSGQLYKSLLYKFERDSSKMHSKFEDYIKLYQKQLQLY